MGRKKSKPRRYGDGAELTEIYCRSVGPGGTTVRFQKGKDANSIVCVWTNENCPYSFEGDAKAYDPVTRRAKDEHNVSYLTREDLELMLHALGEES